MASFQIKNDHIQIGGWPGHIGLIIVGVGPLLAGVWAIVSLSMEPSDLTVYKVGMAALILLVGLFLVTAHKNAILTKTDLTVYRNAIFMTLYTQVIPISRFNHIFIDSTSETDFGDVGGGLRKFRYYTIQLRSDDKIYKHFAKYILDAHYIFKPGKNGEINEKFLHFVRALREMTGLPVRRGPNLAWQAWTDELVTEQSGLVS